MTEDTSVQWHKSNRYICIGHTNHDAALFIGKYYITIMKFLKYIYISCIWLYWSQLVIYQREDIFTFGMTLNSEINKLNMLNYIYNYVVIMYKCHLCYNI